MSTKCKVSVFTRHVGDHPEEWAFEWGFEPDVTLEYVYDGDMEAVVGPSSLWWFSDSFLSWFKTAKAEILRSLNEVVDFEDPIFYVKDDRIVGLCRSTPETAYVEIDITWERKI